MEKTDELFQALRAIWEKNHRPRTVELNGITYQAIDKGEDFVPLGTRTMETSYGSVSMGGDKQTTPTEPGEPDARRKRNKE